MTRSLLIVAFVLFQGAVNPRSADNALDGQFAKWSVTNNRLQWGYDPTVPGSTSDFNRRYGVIYNVGITGLTASPKAYGDEGLYDCASLVGSADDSTATEPGALRFEAGTSVGCIHGNVMWRAGKNLHYQTYAAVTIASASNNPRSWWGLSDQTPTTMAGADDPAGNYAGFLYSEAASSAGVKFQCVSKDNVTQQLTDSGITVDGFNTTSDNRIGHKFDIIDAGATYYFYIDDVLKCTHATHVPTSGTVMQQMWTAKRSSGAAIILHATYSWVEADNK